MLSISGTFAPAQLWGRSGVTPGVTQETRAHPELPHEVEPEEKVPEPAGGCQTLPEQNAPSYRPVPSTWQLAQICAWE